MDTTVSELRRFGRFFTRRIGVLDPKYLNSGFSVAEARMIYELAQQAMPPSVLASRLAMDRGFVSRVIGRFAKGGLVRIEADPADGRRQTVSLTPRGRKQYRDLDRASSAAAAALLGGVPEADRGALAASLRRARLLLGDQPEGEIAFRGLEAGDIGWITMRQGQIYAGEYGWDHTYEALVARILGEFVTTFDPGREAAWIAHRGGVILGSVFLVAKSATVAKLRLLYVEPSARGLGLGRKLVRVCTRHARDMGFRRIELWTQSNLLAARHLYEGEGYRLVSAEPHVSFGKELIGETWDMRL